MLKDIGKQCEILNLGYMCACGVCVCVCVCLEEEKETDTEGQRLLLI